MRTAGDVTLPLAIDRADPRPLPRQLADELRTAIGNGLVAAGEPVPASRALAQRLGVSRGTVVSAYDQLLAEGYLLGRVGHGTVVNPALRELHPPTMGRASAGRRDTGPSLRLIDLRPGQPWTADIVNTAWRAAWRRAAAHPLAPLPAAGLPELRTEIADHLRRMRGVRRAAEHVVIVEDDYDSELRYTSAPLPALAALDDPDDGCVVTLGTFAKTLGPGLGVGFLLAPDRLVDELRRTRSDLGQPVSQVAQWALADYLASGELRRHTQRMRREYRRRRALVLEVLGDLPDVRVKAMDGGLHAVVESQISEAELISRIRDQGVVVAGLTDYWSRPASGTGGIVLGYGGVPIDELQAGLAAIAEAARDRDGASTGTRHGTQWERSG